MRSRPRGTPAVSVAHRSARRVATWVMAAMSRSFLVGKWCSRVPRATPAQSCTSVTVVPPNPRSTRQSTAASSSFVRVASRRACCVRRGGAVGIGSPVPAPRGPAALRRVAGPLRRWPHKPSARTVSGVPVPDPASSLARRLRRARRRLDGRGQLAGAAAQDPSRSWGSAATCWPSADARASPLTPARPGRGADATGRTRRVRALGRGLGAGAGRGRGRVRRAAGHRPLGEWLPLHSGWAQQPPAGRGGRAVRPARQDHGHPGRDRLAGQRARCDHRPPRRLEQGRRRHGAVPRRRPGRPGQPGARRPRTGRRHPARPDGRDGAAGRAVRRGRGGRRPRGRRRRGVCRGGCRSAPPVRRPGAPPPHRRRARPAHAGARRRRAVGPARARHGRPGGAERAGPAPCGRGRRGRRRPARRGRRGLRRGQRVVDLRRPGRPGRRRRRRATPARQSMSASSVGTVAS